MAQYEGKVIAEYGGKAVAKDSEPDLYEGDYVPSMVVILEFETREAAHACYDAPDYARIRAICFSAATTKGLIAVGT